MRRHFAYGSSLDPLSRSGTVTGSVTPGGAFASSLTSSGRTLSSGGTSRGTFTVPTLTADVYTPSGGTGAGYDTSRVYTFTGTGAGIDGFTPTQETTPDYLTFQPTLPTFTRSLAIRPGYTVPTRATLPAGTVTSSGRGGFSFAPPTRATLPGGRRVLPWSSVTSAPRDIPVIPDNLFDTYTVPDTSSTPSTYTVPPLDTRGGIGEYLTSGAPGYVVPYMPAGGVAVRKGAQEAKPAKAEAAPAPSAFPWGWLLLAAGAGAAYLYTRKRGSAS